MSDVRARVLALADEQRGGKADEQCFERLALAAYRMAIEDATRACDGTTRHITERSVWTMGVRDGATQCAAAVRALAEGL